MVATKYFPTFNEFYTLYIIYITSNRHAKLFKLCTCLAKCFIDGNGSFIIAFNEILCVSKGKLGNYVFIAPSHWLSRNSIPQIKTTIVKTTTVTTTTTTTTTTVTMKGFNKSQMRNIGVTYKVTCGYKLVIGISFESQLPCIDWFWWLLSWSRTVLAYNSVLCLSRS